MDEELLADTVATQIDSNVSNTNTMPWWLSLIGIGAPQTQLPATNYTTTQPVAKDNTVWYVVGAVVIIAVIGGLIYFLSKSKK